MFNIDLSQNSNKVSRCNATIEKLYSKVNIFDHAKSVVGSYLKDNRKTLSKTKIISLFDNIDSLDGKIDSILNAISKIQTYKTSINTSIEGLTPMNSHMADTRTLKAIGDRVGISTNEIEAYKKAVTKKFLQDEYDTLADLAAKNIPDTVRLDIERCAAWHHIHQSGCNSSERDSVVMIVMQRYLPKLGLSWSKEDFPGCNLERLEECSK